VKKPLLAIFALFTTLLVTSSAWAETVYENGLLRVSLQCKGFGCTSTCFVAH